MDRQYYTPALNRNLSIRSESSATSIRPAADYLNMATGENSAGARPRRQKSLVRPERERIDASHRQYHYRKHATNRGADHVAPSTTGNQPLPQQQQFQQQEQLHQQQDHSPYIPDHSGPSTADAIRPVERKPSKRLERRPTARKQLLRRGRSILGREEKNSDEETEDVRRRDAIGAGEQSSDADFGRIVYSKKGGSFWANLPDPWQTYCRVLTCCVPGHALLAFGIPAGPAQQAWREKIGLLSFIAVVMGFVGFLTFGFTQAVCPTPPLSVQGGQVSQGYLIIQGWAYLLSDWNGHPAIQGLTNDSTNIMYPPVNAGGLDASFLFQDGQSACSGVLTSKKPSSASSIYFPCQLFNPNDTSTYPDPSTFSNQTQCHMSSTARNMYTSFRDNGVPKKSGGYDKAARVYYDWADINSTSHLTVYNGDVLNLQLLQSLPTSEFSYASGGLIETALKDQSQFGGRDMTRAIASNRLANSNWEKEAECLAATIKIGSLDTLSSGCMASEIVLYLSLVVILGVILTKFFLAVIFGWFLSWRLGNFKEGQSYRARMQRQEEIEAWSRGININAPLPRPKTMLFDNNGSNAWKKRSILPQTSRFTQPMHGITRFDAEKPTTPVWMSPASVRAGAGSGMGSRPGSFYMSGGSPSSRFFGSVSPNNYSTPGLSPRRNSIASSSDLLSSGDSSSGSVATCPFPLSPFVVPQPAADYMPFKFPLAHTICLVTCYSESLDGIRVTLDSVATSDYPNSHKLILVICDGIITGHGNTMSTPDACVSMMRDFIVPPEQVEPYTYVAIADGSKQNSMAKVYAGYYKYDPETIEPAHQQRVPMITIVKCGTPEEAATAKKPGNRGKRDSQIILMQFMQKVIFDERLTQMEYEFFNSIWRVTGVPPDSYEICLMVDADTKLYPDALTRLVSCCVKDPEISGLCGETKIANKTQSWVSMIQVFEYYISHHQSKAFESIFGGVTCLPGCFCMYRIKAPKGPNGYWVPVLANPDIVEHYSENVVDTLHKKNLLLLGEDRYLSTLMLRTFPNRKMMFVPQAVCKTVVPDSFSVLLSQRRRWINSTIHNLMELLFVHDLCGTFCFSMQFVVFMELVGTLALPAAISFTLYLIILAIIGRPAIIPLVLLALILGLPAVLIVMTSRKVVYVGWMLVYLISLPIWNFVLPMYAYWHFDDFSWGDTRKVEGNEKDKGHGDKEGVFDSSQIVMRKWSEYEKERRTKLALERNMAPPRFVERPRSVDIFRDPMFLSKYQKKAGSTGSSDSEAPLTQAEYDPREASRSATTSYATRLAATAIANENAPVTSDVSSRGNAEHTLAGEGVHNAQEPEKHEEELPDNDPQTVMPKSASPDELHYRPLPPAPPAPPPKNNVATGGFTDKQKQYAPNYYTPALANSWSGDSWANPAPHHSDQHASNATASSSRARSSSDASSSSTSLPIPHSSPPESAK